MNIAILRCMILAMALSCINLGAVTDEDEWAPEKHKLIGGGLCALAVLSLIYAKATGMEVEYEMDGQLFCTQNAPGVDSFHTFIACCGFHGCYYLFRGFTGWGLENISDEESQELTTNKNGIVQALKRSTD